MKIFIMRPVSTSMLFLSVFIVGIYSLLHIPIELAPKEDFPQLNIQTTWDNIPPEVIQSHITSPLEEMASEVKGVKRITSSSRDSYSRITLEFNPETDMNHARLSLREKIRGLKGKLPYGARPEIEPYTPKDFLVNPFLSYTISGDYSLQKLRELVKDKIELGMGSITGVENVEVSGGSDPEIKVILNEQKLKSLKIHPFLVRKRFQEITRSFPSGKIKEGTQEFLIKVLNPLIGVKGIGETVITFSGKNPVKLKDVASIVSSYKAIHYISRINGQPTIRLTIQKERGANTLKVAREVKKRLEEIKKELPQDLIFRLLDDHSKEIQKRLKELYCLLGIITFVIFILIYSVFKSYMPSFLILSSIVFSVFMTFSLIYFFKIPLNLLTLGGLALGFGLFVDNSIVVFENVLRLSEKGLAPVKAAVQGSKEVFLPVLAATLTTISVFFSFGYFQGRLKIYYLPLAVIISSALAASLLVSFSLIPALSPYLLKRKTFKRKEWFRKFYEKLLRMLLRHSLAVVFVLIILFYGSYRLFRTEVIIGEWFPWNAGQELFIGIQMPPGTPIEWIDNVAKKFEEMAFQEKSEKNINTWIMAESASIRIKFPPYVEFSYKPYLLKERLIRLATDFAGVGVYIQGFDPQGYASSLGNGFYYDSSISFYGYNLKKLKEITTSLEQTLKRNPRVKDVRIISSSYGPYFRRNTNEYILKINRHSLGRYDVDPQYLYKHLSLFFQGRVSAPIKATIGRREVEVSIKFPELEKINAQALQDSIIQTQRGKYVKLGEITKLETTTVPDSIDRKNQQYQQTLMWEFKGPPKAAQKYCKSIFSNLVLPPGFSAKLEDYGRWMTEEEKGQMKFAVLFSLIAIFMILASLYESLIHPFFILLAVPLALIGVFMAFVLTGFPFDSSAYIGVILLGGIVVNNSILLVDHIHTKEKEGRPSFQAVIEGARERIRPIFLTTGTTVLGMLPLVLVQIKPERRQIWSALALSTIGGLISSTIFILISIPIFYYYGDRIRTFLCKKA